jgi:glutaminyl-peptide cyclotransferase
MKKKPVRKNSPKPAPPKSKKKVKPGIKKILVVGLLVIIMGLIAAILYPSSKPSFNGERAFEYLKLQCNFGPRSPGSEGHQLCGDFLAQELEKFADKVWEQKFEYRDKQDTAQVYQGRNLVASFNLKPRKNYRVLLCAHWDTRPYADKDPDPAKHRSPVPGANDGASGVAVLLEMARILHDSKPDFGVDIVFFDLEDLGAYNASLFPDSLNQFCIGSDYFVSHMPDYRPKYGILLDMIGDRDLVIKKEGYSQTYAAGVVGKVWQAAQEVGAVAFVDEMGEALHDDHLAFLRKGIPVIDLIDFDYPYWHTAGDTPDKCSAESLQQVGDVLVEVLFSGQ